MNSRIPAERARSPLAQFRTVQVLTYGLLGALVVLAVAEPDHRLLKAGAAVFTTLINAILN